MYPSSPAAVGSLVGYGRIVKLSGVSMLPGNLVASTSTVSPSAGGAATYTRPITSWSGVTALVMTMPP